MLWVQKMNNISNQAREIIYKEIIATKLKMIQKHKQNTKTNRMSNTDILFVFVHISNNKKW